LDATERRGGKTAVAAALAEFYRGGGVRVWLEPSCRRTGAVAVWCSDKSLFVADRIMSMERSVRPLFSLTALVLGVATLAGAIYLTMAMPRGSSAGATVGGPFSLTGPDNRIVTDQDLRGEPFLVFFGFTHCPDACPTTLFEMSEVLRKVGPDKKVRALYITVDPERDTPAVLKDYLASFDPRIIGLSGPRPDVEAAMRAYRVYAKKVPLEDGNYTMDHTALVYLMDRSGKFVNVFNLEQPVDQAAQQLSAYL
jgi:protein SCO1